MILVWSVALFGSIYSLRAAEGAFEGLPPIRTFPFESIGTVSRSARLSFDGFGRLVVVEEGAYSVLNDAVWLDLSNSGVDEKNSMIALARAPDGKSYYGAFGGFGLVSYDVDGKVRGDSLSACGNDEWTKAAIFDDVIATSYGVYFVSWNGIAYYEYATERTLCIPTASIPKAFRVGERVFASLEGHGIYEVDTGAGVLEPVWESDKLLGARVGFAIPLNDESALVADSSGELWRFFGTEIEPWDILEKLGLSGDICGLQHLVDGGFAIAILGKGLFIVDEEGRLLVSLESSEYHQIFNMGANEAGVLWVVSERSIDKIQYGNPLVEYGQRLGLSLDWPQVNVFGERLLVASGGNLYEAIDSGVGRACRFELAKKQLPGHVLFITSDGEHVLLGNSGEIFSLLPNGDFRSVAVIDGLVNLAMLGNGLCFVIGRGEIAVLEYRGGEWVDAVPRAAGLPYGPIVHATEKSVWVEMGGEGVARLWVEDGVLKRFTLKNEDWSSARWVNIGVLDDFVVLSGRYGERKFFDERVGTWGEAPEFEALLNRYPKQIDRMAKDADGVIWATHSEGVVRFVPVGDDYALDSYGLELINDRYPLVRILDGRDVWINAGRSLMRVKRGNLAVKSEVAKPVLVSLKVGRGGVEYVKPSEQAPAVGWGFPYSQSSVSFRFFSGGYGWKSVPVYEYRLSEGEAWTRLDSSSLIAFGNLGEGSYSLQVRTADMGSELDQGTQIDFEIFAPWYRTGFAYAFYGVAFMGVLGGGMKFSSHFERRRRRELERLVEQRTSELKSTMERLNTETRNSATLAERNRLAGEIHDSLQQGIIGAIIQLDATLSSVSVSAEVKSRLKIVRNMVSYVRQEVQHLVWDLDSTLHDSELGEVLKDLVSLLNTETSAVELRQRGAVIKLPYSVRHNLLRIAQESTTNAIRHSGASRISIELSYSIDSVSLHIRDNGVGFDPDDILSDGRGHFGIRGIRSRVKQLKGELSIKSTVGDGTSVCVSVPVVFDSVQKAYDCV